MVIQHYESDTISIMNIQFFVIIFYILFFRFYWWLTV